MNKIIRLLLIEDDDILKERIYSRLKTQKDFIILKADKYVTISAIKINQLKPNVILLDLELRNQNSLQVVELLKLDFPSAKIIIMDLPIVKAKILQFVEAGANGFMLKDAPIKDFLATIRSVAEGGSVLPPLLINSLFSQIVNSVIKKGALKLNDDVQMTRREKEVIVLLSDGLSNKEIGQKIHISTYTVKSHIHNIMEKLALHTRLEIANYSYTIESRDLIAKNISTISN